MLTVSRLHECDPIAVARPFLIAHPDVIEALGGGDVSEHITDRNEPPYPHVRLYDPPGSDRGLLHLVAPLLQVEVHGDLDGTHGKPLLRRILYVVLGALAEMPEQSVEPGEPVVTSVLSTGGGGFVPEPTGQARYLATVQMFLHPST